MLNSFEYVLNIYYIKSMVYLFFFLISDVNNLSLFNLDSKQVGRWYCAHHFLFDEYYACQSKGQARGDLDFHVATIKQSYIG